MTNNSEIESIVEQAIEIARDKKHEFVITEHLLLAMIRYQPFRKLLDKFGTDTEHMEIEIDTYLSGLINIVTLAENIQPRKTQALERIFNRANVQAMFTDAEH